jgi:hypothetical protein
MVPQAAPIFVDGQTMDLLKYYLARNAANLDAWPGIRQGATEQLGNYRIVVVMSENEAILRFRPDEMLEPLAEAARLQGLPSGSPLWVVSWSWSAPPLVSRLPAKEHYDGHEFGNISVVRVVPTKTVN